MARRLPALTSLFVLATGGTGCLSWFSEEIAAGTARLTVRNLGAITGLVMKDSACGFASSAVQQGVEIESMGQGRGRAVFRVKDCTLAMPEEVTLSTDCTGHVTLGRGNLTVRARQILVGRLTNDPKEPIIPDDSGSVSIELDEVRFDNFAVRVEGNGNWLEMTSGSLSARLVPRLAASESNSACTVATPNVAFSEIRYANAVMILHTPDRDIDVEVQASDLSAQSGQGADGGENVLSGSLTLWDSEETVPGSDDTDGLDPDYERQTFIGTYACTSDLAWPPRFDCNSDDVVALGVARLTMRTFAGLAQAMAGDGRCGLAASNAAASFTGVVGERGEHTTTATACDVTFAAHTLSEDCNGSRTWIDGRATVDATQRIQGWITGDPTHPAVPAKRDAAQVTVSGRLENFAVRSGDGRTTMIVHRGEISGVLVPRLGLDKTLGACSTPTGVALLDNVVLRDADVEVRDGDKRISAHVEETSLRGINGARDGSENRLNGWVRLSERRLDLPSEGVALDPEYDAARFASSTACHPDLDVDASDEMCNFEDYLSQATARLLMRVIAYTAKGLDAEPSCGFASVDSMLPANLEDAASGLATAHWNIPSCSLDGAQGGWEIAQDCLSTRYTLYGRAETSGTKSVTGALSLAYPPIKPQDRVSAFVAIHRADLDDFAVVEHAAGAAEPEPYLEIVSGRLSGVVQPITAEAANDSGAYYIPTTVVGFDAVRLENAEVILHAGKKQFHVPVASSDIDAFNGSFDGQTNALSGSITAFGKTFTLTDGLRPDYDQERFDATYTCTPNMAGLVPPG